MLKRNEVKEKECGMRCLSQHFRCTGGGRSPPDAGSEQGNGRELLISVTAGKQGGEPEKSALWSALSPLTISAGMSFTVVQGEAWFGR